MSMYLKKKEKKNNSHEVHNVVLAALLFLGQGPPRTLLMGDGSDLKALMLEMPNVWLARIMTLQRRIWPCQAIYTYYTSVGV